MNLLLKTSFLNDKRKGMDLLSCVILNIMRNSCINIDIMKNYTEEYFAQGIVDCCSSKSTADYPIRYNTD